MVRLCIVLLLSVSCLGGCALFRGIYDSEFESAEKFMAEKRYSQAVATYDKIARDSPETERGAYALYSSAQVRAFYDNPQKDYAQALQEFDEFVRKYPDHEKVRDAQNWRHFLKIILDLKKENERLNQSIEQLKKIDIKHEERRRK